MVAKLMSGIEHEVEFTWMEFHKRNGRQTITMPEPLISRMRHRPIDDVENEFSILTVDEVDESE